jgi:uncharacterized protein (TIGR00297 family)
VTPMRLIFQSKLILLLVMPFVAADVVLEARWWATQAAPVAIWTVGLSAVLGLVVLKLRAATPAASAAGAAITASLMFSSVIFPYKPWHTALMPVLAVALLAHLSTRLGQRTKEQIGSAEKRRGRAASQVAANLGVAALAANGVVQSWLTDSHWFGRAGYTPMPLFAIALAALAGAAGDTVSSEVGQVLGGRPRMVTTLQQVEPGVDGAISSSGTLAGVAAVVIVAAAGTLAMFGDVHMYWISCAGGVFCLFFDSLLGATLEQRGWLNNDAVNFLSTASAAAFALGLMAVLAHAGVL